MQRGNQAKGTSTEIKSPQMASIAVTRSSKRPRKINKQQKKITIRYIRGKMLKTKIKKKKILKEKRKKHILFRKTMAYIIKNNRSQQWNDTLKEC